MKKTVIILNLSIFIVFLLFLGPRFLWAQEAEGEKDFQTYTLGEQKGEDDYQVYTIGEVVVKGKDAVRDIAINNEVNPEDFKVQNNFSVSDALTWVPGVQVTTGRKNFTSFNIHGFDQNRILTLIDGVPYYETKYGGLAVSQLALEGIARIDVVKGAGSVLYGANQLGGVVNIITKKGTEKPSLSANGQYGLDGLENAYRFSAFHGMKKGILNYFISYAHQQRDAWDLSNDYNVRPTNINYRGWGPGGPPSDTRVIQEEGERLNSDYKTDNFWGKVGLESDKGSEVFANFHYIKTEQGDPPLLNQINVFPDFSWFDRIPSYDDWGIDLSGRHSFTDNFNLTARAFYHNHVDDYASYFDETYQDELALSTYEDYILGGIVIGEFVAADWNTLRGSLHYKGDSHKQRDLEDLPFAESFAYTGSAGLEDEGHFVNDRLSIVAGVSYDWFNVTQSEADPDNDGNIVDLDEPDTKDTFNPMIGARFEVNDATQLFGSIARKSRFPTLEQLYSSNSGNTELGTEESINYALGVRWISSYKWKFELAPFYHDISDWISRDGPRLEGTYQNYQNVTMLGFECNAELTPVDDFIIRAGFMYNDAKDKSEGAVTDKVRGVPVSIFDLSLQYILPRIRTKLDGTLLYVGESYDQLPTPANPDDPEVLNKDYTVINGKIAQPFLNGRLEAYLAGNNILDAYYEPTANAPAPGRTIWLGLTFRL